MIYAHLSSKFTHYFCNFVETEKKNEQTFLLRGYMITERTRTTHVPNTSLFTSTAENNGKLSKNQAYTVSKTSRFADFTDCNILETALLITKTQFQNKNTIQCELPPREKTPQKPLSATQRWFFSHCVISVLM